MGQALLYLGTQIDGDPNHFQHVLFNVTFPDIQERKNI